jgi:hypothetical protein
MQFVRDFVEYSFTPIAETAVSNVKAQARRGKGAPEEMLGPPRAGRCGAGARGPMPAGGRSSIGGYRTNPIGANVATNSGALSPK